MVISSAKTEAWDGTSWTEVNDLNTAKSNESAGPFQVTVL